MDIALTDISIGSVSHALHIHINNVFVTCKPPSCSSPEPWRLDESACELEGNEHGCRSVIQHESDLAKFTADVLRCNNHQSWKSSIEDSRLGKNI